MQTPPKQYVAFIETDNGETEYATIDECPSTAEERVIERYVDDVMKSGDFDTRQLAREAVDNDIDEGYVIIGGHYINC